MEIRIRVNGRVPPEGVVIPDPDAASGPGPAGGGIPFTGWLGLIKALSEALEVRDEGSPPR